MIHQVGLPYHWGYGGPDHGDSANDLGVISGDPNVSIQESKAFTCDVRAGRRGRATTARLAGARGARAQVGASGDDPLAENPKEVAQ
jgi:formate dehydrogenase major subunit